MRAEKLAVFVHENGFSVRNSALHETVETLRPFVMENELIRSLPQTDWDIFRGPEEIVGERRIPLSLVQQLLAKELIRTVTISPR